MIRTIERIRYCGVFNDYSKPAAMQDFTEVNIIYGWNYCGKTTLSRVIHCLESRKIPASMTEAAFTLTSADASPITQSGLNQHNLEVRVFNSDFVDDNLRWDGKDFNPILLLGDDSIEAVEEIKRKTKISNRCRDGYSNKNRSIDNIEKNREDKTRDAAKRIRQNLGITGAFNATHLNKLIDSIGGEFQNHILKNEQKNKLLSLALTNEADKKSTIPSTALMTSIDADVDRTLELLASNPEAKNAIQYLTENGNIAKWVQDGLSLHEGKSTCEYCHSEISEERNSELKSHFSDDLKLFEAKLERQKKTLLNHVLKYKTRHESDISKDLSSEFKAVQVSILSEVESFNQTTQKLIERIDKKIGDPFVSIVAEKHDPTQKETIDCLVRTMNNLIDSHNASVRNFESEKRDAVDKLKLHYSAEHGKELSESGQQKLKTIFVKHRDWYERAGKELNSNISVLEQTINKAQKGRAELNSHIERFLSDSKIKIEVVDVDGNDRFILTRNGEIAQNLSEGEKTAIAFSFFLCSLGQSTDLGKVIVYIDDPISSLDSNHIFQINAVIKDYFFAKDIAGKWILNVLQLFVSTHNFEFLGLLKELPINNKNRRSYYYISRLMPGESSFDNMPLSIEAYSSEYQFLWSFIHTYAEAGDKTDITVLMSMPNAIRRFIELYTYAKIPSTTGTTVDDRATILFGAEKSKRILKVLHYFSHSNDIGKMAKNSDLICDIDSVVKDVINLVRKDTLHFDALMESLPN